MPLFSGRKGCSSIPPTPTIIYNTITPFNPVINNQSVGIVEEVLLSFFVNVLGLCLGKNKIGIF